MSKILYIAEGEIEKRFIDFLKHEEFIVAGRFAKFNLMQDKLKESNDILTRKMDKIFCILDTDVVNISNLLFNLKKLADICPKNIFTLIQNRNFEDETNYSRRL